MDKLFVHCTSEKCTRSRTSSHGRHKSPRPCRCSVARPTADKFGIFQTGFSHSRKEWKKENPDHPAVLVKRSPKHLFHTFQRDPRKSRIQQYSSKSSKVLCWICSSRGWRLETRPYASTQKNTTPKTTQQLAN